MPALMPLPPSVTPSHDVDEAQRDSDNAIHEAQASLQRLRQEFENGLNSAKRDLEFARHDVEDTQRRVDSLDNDIRWIERRIHNEPWYNCPPLIAEKAGLLAEAVVHGTGFATAQGAIGLAEFALGGMRIEKSEALITKDALEEVNSAQQELIQAAINSPHAAKTASEELHVFDLAKEALS
ncbi:hypothetical protein TARUN_3322 [Trichoderma arundinaceum]|uniref:Uncharacterized protein n=1 Tax=Trichoderma arundinaceum TaxID=490622 RepID=A0A395NS73_TRIAR|nr:hypothetical protein TARUN_3322 [Trichoderma arundinaceum]